ncbi:ribosomal L7Ae/L30e/S12e/Gadd45 family protein [Candidatus Woesearchaeota archaeon]|nr:ribosomal L7Ae/L30e/S12e/Gadd45 family protein [Candidatus Woesearchaeota archaeon]
MAKKITSAEIKKMIKAGDIILGTKRAVKNLRLGKVGKIMVSANCPARVEENISRYALLAGAEFQKLEFQNDELGVICKKPFSISVLAVSKGAK